MGLKDLPIRKKLMAVILLINGTVMLLTCMAYFMYEFISFKQSNLRELSTLAEIVASNTTAALAFDDQEAANEILQTLRADKHVQVAVIYDSMGHPFSKYLVKASSPFPDKPLADGYLFESNHLLGFQPILQGNKRLGTLYLQADMKALYERLELYALVALVVTMASFVLAYLLSLKLQRSISTPISDLVSTASAISKHSDYSVRARKSGNDELGVLTDAFNHMLKQIEEQNDEITLFNIQLEQKVKRRTHELEVANKELEAFSYTVSHDLRAPLRAINGYINILLEDYGDKLDPEAIQLSHNVLGNAAKMRQLIDDLLDFFRVGRKELVREPVHMKEMVESLVADLRLQESDREIHFDIQDLPTIEADNSAIKQVWVNLLSNALKYSRDKAKTLVEIGFKEEEDTIVYFVKDNGAGFDMRYKHKLFGVFQRLHSQEEFEGTGIGLAIIQRVVAKHGGRVWAESELGQGATFYFSLSKY